MVAAALLTTVSSNVAHNYASLQIHGYSWLRNTIGESAGQCSPAAWPGRLGLLAFALSAWLVAARRRNCRPVSALLYLGFGVAVLFTAYFPTNSWPYLENFDANADSLHQFAAALAVILASAAIAVDVEHARGRDALMNVSLFAVIAFPALGYSIPSINGALDRVVFALILVHLWRLTSDTSS